MRVRDQPYFVILVFWYFIDDMRAGGFVKG